MGLFSGAEAYVGELAALAAALLWAIAASIFARLGDRVSPLAMNLVKGFVAIALLLLTLIILKRPFPMVELNAILLLLLSGVVGIGLGDTFYFRSLTLIGARRSLLLESLAPPLAAVLALIFLDERLSLANVIGIGLTLGGVGWVVSERMEVQASSDHSPAGSQGQQPEVVLSGQAGEARSRQLMGLGYGLLAALGQGGGAVLSRAGLANTAMDPLWSTLLRILAGVALLLLWLPLAQLSPVLAAPGAGPSFQRSSASGSSSQPSFRQVRSFPARGLQLPSPRLLGMIAITAFFSTYLAIWLQQTALKYAPTGIAQALTSTSPLFILPIAVLLGERLSIRACGGVLISLLGIVLLFQ